MPRLCEDWVKLQSRHFGAMKRKPLAVEPRAGSYVENTLPSELKPIKQQNECPPLIVAVRKRPRPSIRVALDKGRLVSSGVIAFAEAIHLL